MIKYIVFDVDRTLVDSYEPEILSFCDAIKNVSGYILNNSEKKNFTVMPTKVFLHSLNLNDNQINMVMKEWERTFSKCKTLCFNGIKEAIRILHNKGYTLGLITSRTMDEYHELDNELIDISDYFEVIVTSDIVKKPKPNIESMNYLCNKFGCLPSEILYIGDSNIDKEFAKNSQASFIPACYDNKELVNEENACFDPKDLPIIIENITN